MSLLSSVTSILEPIKNLGIPREECTPTKSDDRGDENHKGREEFKNDDREKQAKNDDHRDEKQAKDDDHRDEKQAKNDDHRDDHEKQAKNDDHSKVANNDDCQPHKDDCQPHKDYCAPKSFDDCGKGDTHGPGAELAKFDFSHGDLGSHGLDHSGDVLGALASMSSGHALDYAIGQMGPADHFDVGHFDVPAATSHDVVHHA